MDGLAMMTFRKNLKKLICGFDIDKVSACG
jgi:hypothetical protein